MESPEKTDPAAEPYAAESGLSPETETEASTGESPQFSEAEAVESVQQACDAIRAEIGKVIVGQEQVVEEILIAIFTRSHALLVGVPGLAKTLLISTLAKTLQMSFKRVQFTPDLMPSDITGTEMIHQDPATGERTFRFLEGPLFANIVLADEINRTPPKTQAALLEAMQERSVTIGGQTRKLPDPFFVLATQNPLEQEGTYPLPEAQLDRFLFLISVGYPTAEDEVEIMRRGLNGLKQKPEPVLDVESVLRAQQIVRSIPVSDQVVRYAGALARATRPREEGAAECARQWLSFGAGPRASLSLVSAARAHALLRGRPYVDAEDIKAVAPSILRHRIATNFAAQGEGITTDAVVEELLATISPNQDFSR
ncbi:MAG: MoxR family ATPase [Verrucomicrobiota bacterium JB024]|nr:MoxR family ATPase [Verrucomicrobiota bacterium JB024]